MPLNLLLHLPVLLVLADLYPALLPTLPLVAHGLPIDGVADVVQAQTWLSVTGQELGSRGDSWQTGSYWPALLGHPPGSDILPLHAILSSGNDTAHSGSVVEDEVWKVEKKFS